MYYEDRSMSTEKKSHSIWSTRLKSARLASGMSQRTLGIAAGLDPSIASTRINRYEVGVHEPAYNIACKLADSLKVPVAYLYCDDELLAKFILAYHEASVERRRDVLHCLSGEDTDSR